MGRFFNREAGIVATLLVLAGVAVGLIAGLPAWVVALITFALVLLLHLPLTISFQAWILEWYVERGNFARALALAIDIRDSSMVRGAREKALVDVAFVHLARGDYEHALQNLNRVVTHSLKPATRAVVQASTGYALAWLGRDLDRAGPLIEDAIAAYPQEPLFGFFLAVVRFREGRHAQARDLIYASLEAEPDLALPHPGERPYVLAQVLRGLGDDAGARAALEKARGTRGRFAELAGKELAPAA